MQKNVDDMQLKFNNISGHVLHIIISSGQLALAYIASLPYLLPRDDALRFVSLLLTALVLALALTASCFVFCV